MRNKTLILMSLLVMASMVLGACATPAQPTSAPANQTAQVIEKTVEVVKTVVVTEAGQVTVVTPTAPPAKEWKSADPTTYTSATFGDPDTLDPALLYDTASGQIVQNTHDTLIFYNHEDPNSFVPWLATEVPSAENGGISADGTTYTFKIRQGVKFHDGTEMTPEDVAYTFQRGLLQSGSASPQWLLVEPFFGSGKADIVDVVIDKITAKGSGYPGEDTSAIYDSREELAKVDPAILEEVANDVMSKITFDNAAGTVTMKLAQPWAPFIATLANSWGSITSKKWISSNGGWDGDAKTWQNFYAPSSEQMNETPIGKSENGTGPFKLDHWTPGEEIVLVANEDYWMKEPAWEGAPTGAPALKRVVIKSIDEFSTRFAMLQAGDADSITAGSQADWPQMDTLVGTSCEKNTDSCEETDPNKPLVKVTGLLRPALDGISFNFDINTEGGNNFIGSGKLDGNGIPANFFSDAHVRKGFAYCFNYQNYLDDVLQGEGERSKDIMLPGMIGYDDNSPFYDYDVEKCKTELQASKWKENGDGTYTPDDNGTVSLWDTGFRFSTVYNTGNTSRQTAAQILQTELSAVNDKFIVEVVGLPWPTFLRNQRAANLPIFISGWLEDIHDPHNWVQPYTTGTYGGRQRLPQDIKDKFQEIMTRAVEETDPAKRGEIYKEFNQLFYETAHTIPLFASNTRRYQQRWVQGWYWNPIYPGTYFYPISKQ